MKIDRLVYRLFPIILSAAGCLSFVYAEDINDETGFVLLFNGKNLSGWEGDLRFWNARDGMLIGHSPGIDHYSFLTTTSVFEDFVLRLQIKLVDGKGNSGVLFRSKRVPDSHEVAGYQADFAPGRHGNIYDEARRRKILARPDTETLATCLKPTDWNNYEVRAEGRRILLFMNGVKLVDYVESDATIARRGLFALQIHKGGPMEVRFRNIRIKEIKTVQKAVSDHPHLRISTEQPAPVIVHVGAVDHNLLALCIEAQRTQRSAVQRYEPFPGDKTKIHTQAGIVKWVELIRGGKPVAYLAGKDRKHIWFFEKLVGAPLDTDKADDPATYTLMRAGDSRTYTPRVVYRKSKPIDIVNPVRICPKRHTLYLKLPFTLEAGQTYTLRMPGLGLKDEETTFRFDPQTMRSEAVHMNHIGFHPDDPVKNSYLSVWLGNGGAHAFQHELHFTLLDHESGQRVFTGVVGEAWPAERPEAMRRKQNYSLTDVAYIDFSSFSQPGTYRLCVDTIGCSYPFVIGESIWEKPFLTSMKGFFQQRSGMTLGPPYTTYTRPRPYHPDDGLQVYASDVTLMETRNGLNLLGESSNFEALNRQVTDHLVENAWGGYFDAADWDRRIQHLSASRLHLELLALFPETFTHMNLNIPESGDAIPDILDEALFNLDCYRRLQTAEGGIRGGIEAAEHPVRGETSWLESLRIMTYAPGPWSSYVYAGVAARAAFLLRPFDSHRAAVFKKSARCAWDWAEANRRPFERKYGKHARWTQVNDERNLAALELYRLTEDSQWHDRFLEDSILVSPQPRRRQRHALFLYARLAPDLGRPRLKQAAKAILLSDAEAGIAFARQNAWGLVSTNPYSSVVTGWFSTPDLIPLMRAHILTGDRATLAAIVRGLSFSLGANPMNMTYTTGVGHVWPYNAMVLDTRRTARAVPEGITVFGQVDYAYARARRHTWHLGALDWFLARNMAIYPDPFTWPVNESYWDIHQWPSACEFTPQRTMGNVSYMWGFMVAQGKK
jgi:endoglucanase